MSDKNEPADAQGEGGSAEPGAFLTHEELRELVATASRNAAQEASRAAVEAVVPQFQQLVTNLQAPKPDPSPSGFRIPALDDVGSDDIYREQFSGINRALGQFATERTQREAALERQLTEQAQVLKQLQEAHTRLSTHYATQTVGQQIGGAMTRLGVPEPAQGLIRNYVDLALRQGSRDTPDVLVEQAVKAMQGYHEAQKVEETATAQASKLPTFLVEGSGAEAPEIKSLDDAHAVFADALEQMMSDGAN